MKLCSRCKVNNGTIKHNTYRLKSGELRSTYYCRPCQAKRVYDYKYPTGLTDYNPDIARDLNKRLMAKYA